MDTTLTPTLSVIVPAYNEAESIAGAISKNIQILDKAGLDYELIIVNDASRDNTLQLLNDLYGQTSRLKIESHGKNEGFGGAVNTGMQVACKEAILVVPVDSPLNEELLTSFLNNYHKGDVLVSYRTERKGYTPVMRFNSWLYQKIISLLFDMDLKDYNWIHLYKKEALRKKGILIQSKGIFMLAEVLIKAKRGGLSIFEFPVDHDRRVTGSPSAVKLSVMFKTAQELCKQKWLLKR